MEVCNHTSAKVHVPKPFGIRTRMNNIDVNSVFIYITIPWVFLPIILMDVSQYKFIINIFRLNINFICIKLMNMALQELEFFLTSFISNWIVAPSVRKESKEIHGGLKSVSYA